MLSLLTSGCGIKSDPFPPRHGFYENIGRLDCCIGDDDLLTLNWNLGEVFYELSFRDSVVNIHVAKEPLDCDCCSNCPAIFSQILEIPLCNMLKWNKDGILVSYTDEILRGNKYSYKLKLISRDGYAMFESDLIQFVYPKNGN